MSLDGGDESNEILVASGENKKIHIEVDNVHSFIETTRFNCQFNIEGRVRHVPAQLLGDIIYCDSMLFEYNSTAQNVTATFTVTWGDEKSLDNPNNIRVVIYKCEQMADNCGQCLELADKFKCGWCTNSCRVKEQCSKSNADSNTLDLFNTNTGYLLSKAPTFLDKSQICPNPQILSFWPEVGPINGGTNLTIRGINLGEYSNRLVD